MIIRRGFFSSFLFLAAGFVTSGCVPSSSPPAAATPPPQDGSKAKSPPVSNAGKNWTGEGTFRLVFSDFHFENGQEIVTVDASGKVSDLFTKHELLDTQTFCPKVTSEADRALCAAVEKSGAKQFGRVVWHLAQYTLSDDALKEGRSVLAGARFGALKTSYSNSTIPDGTTRTYKLQTQEGTQKTTAYSIQAPSEPAELVLILRWLQAQRTLHKAERDQAPVIEWKERNKFEQETLEH